MSDQSRVWVMSGCSSGLGRELALAAARQGDRVIAGARNPSDLDAIVAQSAGSIIPVQLDVTLPQHSAAAVEVALKQFGRLDGIVNNAGYGIVGAVEDTPDADIRANFETNFFGALNLTRAALPTLRSRRTGIIVNISAAAAIANYPGFGAYGASKAALEFMSESLRDELRPFGIRVILVQPGPFRTDFISRSLKSVPCSTSEYQATVGRFAGMLEKMSGKQTGDPAKAAIAILNAAKAEGPPFRLALGKYAQDKARRRAASTVAELDLWGPAGVATDFSS